MTSNKLLKTDTHNSYFIMKLTIETQKHKQITKKQFNLFK